MDVKVVTLQSLFQPQVRYEMPDYQRAYVWERERQWEPLWNDVQQVAESHLAKNTSTEESLSLSRDKLRDNHFLGAVVLHQKTSKTGRVTCPWVVDGQQRLTTFQLFLKAAANNFKKSGEPEISNAGKRILLFTQNDEPFRADEDDQFKVWPTDSDRTAFKYALTNEGSEHPEFAVSKIVTAMKYFHEEIEKWIETNKGQEKEAVAALEYALVEGIQLVAIDVEGNDNPHVIFETLNARGTSLEQSDLIKGHVLDVVRGELPDDEPEKHWDFGEAWWLAQSSNDDKSNKNRVDMFLWYWLKMSSQNADITMGDLFENFKSHHKKSKEIGIITTRLSDAGKVFRELDEIPRCPSLKNSEKDARYCRMIAMSNRETIMPVLLRLGLPDVPKEEQEKALQSLDNYLTRRQIYGKTTTSNGFQDFLLNKVLKNVNTIAVGGKFSIGEAVENTLLEHQFPKAEGESWPSDPELMGKFIARPLSRIGSTRVTAILEAVERNLRNSAPPASEQSKSIPSDQLTVEHILPQSWGSWWEDMAEISSLAAPLSEPEFDFTMEEVEQILEDIGK